MCSDRWTERTPGDRSSLLAPRCSHAFDAGVRSRGLSYFSSGRVRLGPVDENGVLAYVKGSRREPYQVVVDWGEVEWGDALTVSCDCQHFDDGSLCKHLWATLLTLDDVGEGHWVPGSGRLELVPDYGFDTDIDDEADDEDEELEDLEDALDELVAVEAESFDPFEEAGEGEEVEEVEDDAEDDLDLDWESSRRPAATWEERSARRADVLEPKPEWQRQLEVVGFALEQNGARGRLAGRDDRMAGRRREIWFSINRAVSAARGRLVIDLFQRQERKTGELGRIKPFVLDEETMAELAEARDRELAKLVYAMPNEHGHWTSTYGTGPAAGSRPPVGRFSVPGPLFDTVLPRLAATGRLSWWEGDERRPERSEPLAWDDGPPWRLALRLEQLADQGVGRLTGTLERAHRTEAAAADGAGADEIAPLKNPILLLAAGLALFEDHLAHLDAQEVFPWIVLLRRDGWIDIPEEDLAIALDELFRLPSLPSIDLPDDLPIEAERPEAHPRLSLSLPARGSATVRGRGRTLRADLSFGYADRWVAAADPRAALVDHTDDRILLRDATAERAAEDLLHGLGIEPDPTALAGSGGRAARADTYLVPAEHLAEIVQHLLEAGWRVEAEGDPVRRGGSFQAAMAGGGSGMDWFELRGAILFGDQEVPFPRLLEAVRQEQTFILLGDGSRGIVPIDWVERLRRLADLEPAAPAPEGAEDGEEVLRFLPSQALLLDGVLADVPELAVDDHFAHFRELLTSGERAEPLAAPEGFVGTLRPYQSEGLGWLAHLGALGLGGCLADDMGLGKTI